MIAFSGDFPASLPRVYPRFIGSFWEQNPIPQLARLWPCLRSDPVLPASTSVLFVGPLGLEVGVGWAEGEAASSFSSCLRGPPHPLTRGLHWWLSPKLCPLPRNGGGARSGQMTIVGEATVQVFFFFSTRSPTLFSRLGIEGEKRGAVEVDFHSISGF